MKKIKVYTDQGWIATDAIWVGEVLAVHNKVINVSGQQSDLPFWCITYLPMGRVIARCRPDVDRAILIASTWDSTFRDEFSPDTDPKQWAYGKLFSSQLRADIPVAAPTALESILYDYTGEITKIEEELEPGPEPKLPNSRKPRAFGYHLLESLDARYPRSLEQLIRNSLKRLDDDDTTKPEN